MDDSPAADDTRELEERLRQHLRRKASRLQADLIIASVLAERTRNASFHVGDAWAFAMADELLAKADSPRKRGQPKPKRWFRTAHGFTQLATPPTDAEREATAAWCRARAKLDPSTLSAEDREKSLRRAENEKSQKLSGRVTKLEEQRTALLSDAADRLAAECIAGYHLAHRGIETQLEREQAVDAALQAAEKLRAGLRQLDEKQRAAVEAKLDSDAHGSTTANARAAGVTPQTQRYREKRGLEKLGEALGLDLSPTRGALDSSHTTRDELRARLRALYLSEQQRLEEIVAALEAANQKLETENQQLEQKLLDQEAKAANAALDNATAAHRREWRRENGEWLKRHDIPNTEDYDGPRSGARQQPDPKVADAFEREATIR